MGYHEDWTKEKKKFQGAAPSLKKALKGTEMGPAMKKFTQQIDSSRSALKKAIDRKENLPSAMAAEKKMIESALQAVQDRVDVAYRMGGVGNIHFADNKMRNDFKRSVDGISSRMKTKMETLTG